MWNRNLLSWLLFEEAHGAAGGVESRHSVNAPSGWGCRRAEEDPVAGIVRVKGQERSRQELPPVLKATVDVAADKGSVVQLVPRGGPGGAGDDDVAEPGGETLDLPLDPFRHVYVGAVGNMAVRPSGL